MLNVKLQTEKDQIVFQLEVLKSELFKVFVSHTKNYLIISSMTKDFIYNRIVLNNTSENFIFWSRDIMKIDNNYKFILNPINSWVRNIGNSSVVLNKYNDIVSFILNIPLEAIRYKDHKDLINLDNESSKNIYYNRAKD